MVKNKSNFDIKYNKYIQAPLGIVKVLDNEGNFIKEMEFNEALKLAYSQDLDLIQLSMGSDKIPVCKIYNISKYKYDLDKKNKEKNQVQKTHQLKILKISLNISQNDLINNKLKQCGNFLNKNHDVEIILRLKGRENIKPDIAINFLKDLTKYFQETWYLKKEPTHIGRDISIIIGKKSI